MVGKSNTLRSWQRHNNKNYNLFPFSVKDDLGEDSKETRESIPREKSEANGNTRRADTPMTKVFHIPTQNALTKLNNSSELCTINLSKGVVWQPFNFPLSYAETYNTSWTCHLNWKWNIGHVSIRWVLLIWECIYPGRFNDNSYSVNKISI